MHSLTDKVSGLYAIADTGTITNDVLYEKVQEVLAGGCGILQYRDKSRDTQKRLQQATRLSEICHSNGAVFIVNDDAELAIEVNADGVHCGKNDATVSEIKRLYPHLLLGASCYSSLTRARKAVHDGADYLAFGSFYPSMTKPQARPADLQVLCQAKDLFQQPIVAIGGIVAANAGILISSGASAVAVISGVFSSPDPCLSSRKITELFKKDHPA